MRATGRSWSIDAAALSLVPLLSLLLVTLVAAPAAADIVVTSPVSLVADMCESCQPPQVILPLTIAGGDATKLTVRPLDVSTANRHDGAYLKAVKAEIVTDKGSSTLQITVAPGTLRDDGTYVVVLEINAEGQKPQTMSLQLVRTAATLHSFGTVVVDRVLGVPWDPPTTVPLTLHETSTRTGLSSIRILPPTPQPPGQIAIETVPKACSSGPADKPGDGLQLSAGGRACLAYTSTGDFPWGSQTQTYSIVSPELATAAPVTFDVRTRLATVYILVFVLLGLIASFIVKVILQRRVEREEARLLAFELLEKVGADLQKHKDSTFTSAIDGLFKALATAADNADAAGIAAARTALDTAWRAALDDLGKRRLAVQQELDVLRSTSETPWKAPTDLLRIVAQLRTATDHIRELLAGGLVTDAAAATQQARQQAVSVLAPALSTWQDNTVTLFDAIAGAPAGLSPTVKDAATQAIAESKAKIGTTGVKPNASADDLLAAMTGAADEYRAAQRVARTVNGNLEREVDRIANVLGVSRADLTDIVDALSTLTKALADAVDRPESGQPAVGNGFAALAAAWKTSLQKHFGKELPSSVTDLLAEQRIVEAAVALKKEILSVQQADQATVHTQFADFARMASDEPVAPVLAFRTAMGPSDPLAPFRLSTIRTRMEIASAKLWQSLTVGLLSGIVAYGLFAPKFLGDYQDFAIIFFWAFSLDLTADAVAKLAPTVRR